MGPKKRPKSAKEKIMEALTLNPGVATRARGRGCAVIFRGVGVSAVAVPTDAATPAAAISPAAADVAMSPVAMSPTASSNAFAMSAPPPPAPLDRCRTASVQQLEAYTFFQDVDMALTSTATTLLTFNNPFSPKVSNALASRPNLDRNESVDSRMSLDEDAPLHLF
ncbi:hypothetical protein M885DRAFT_532185 [Pelagophyceae sp. CCMP2097]|nr:hypothetical protein M885DRAFT_532185 [Pelagophyceae sp. CCMP2097]